MFKLFECSGINIYRYNLPARYGKRRERSADSGFDSVFSGRECCRSGGGAVRNTVSDGCRRAVAAAFRGGCMCRRIGGGHRCCSYSGEFRNPGWRQFRFHGQLFRGRLISAFIAMFILRSRSLFLISI